jgi:hypothetical protein
MDPMAMVDVQQQIQQLEALRRQKRAWQIGISLILLVLVVSCLLILRNAAYGLVREGDTREEFIKDLSTRLQSNALPSIEQIGTQALHEINWQAEVQKLNRRTPELSQASVKELKLLGEHLQTKGHTVLNSTFNTALKERESKIKTMFPEATPDQVNSLMASLTQEAQEQAGDISDRLFSPHKQALDSIVKDLHTIQTAEAPNIKDETPTWEMGLLIFDIARADLKDLEPSGEPKAKKHAKKQEKKR